MSIMGNTPKLLVEMQIYKTALEINFLVSQKVGNSSTLRPSYTIPGEYTQKLIDYTTSILDPFWS